MDSFINLNMIIKNMGSEEILLNTKHIVYIRKYKNKDKEDFTAIFTRNKMIVVEDSFDHVNESICSAEKKLLTA
jgi:uncharacterized protein YlzI (FlbEa/FlbD family)